MSEERVVSDLVWTPERGMEAPEVRGISWENFLLSDDKYLGKWKTDSGIRVTPETAIQSTAVLGCCRILAETVSGLPLHVYRRNPDGGDEIAKEIPLYKILTFRPNDWQTKQEFFEQIVMTLTLWGNSYTRIRSGQYGSVSHLDNLHPSRMDVERLENGRLRYSYTDPETGRLERYTQDQIMHVRWTPEQDGIKGMVPVEIAREAIGLARACEQHAARFWANSARPGVVLTTDGTLTAEAAERLRDNWERLHRGSERAYKTAILTGGLKATELGMTNESSQFQASRDFQTAEIARVYRIPQHLIQGTPGGDLEVQGQEFVTYTLMPWLQRIESAISRSLIYNDDEYYARFDVRGLLRANSNQRASYYSTMIGLGIFSINDCRKAEGMKSLGSLGDHHFVAMNTQTLEEATKPKPEAPPGGAPGGGGGDGPPPPTPGGPPSLPEVKTGKAPIASPKGEASKPKEEPKPQMEEAVEEASAEWEDAIEARAFCSTGEGQGTDNSCSSTAAGAAKVDNSWKKAGREYSYTPGEGKSPIVGGEDIKSLSIERPADLAATMKDLRIKSLTDVVAIGGGLTRGSFTSVIARGDEIHVMSEVPVNPDDEESAGMSSTVTLGIDNEGKKFVDYGTMVAASDAGTANLTGEDAARMSSILLEKFPESLAAAEKAGLSYAKTFAMGSSEDEFKGYRLWPQFGFDGEIYQDIRETIPKDVVPHDDPITVQQLISTPAGKKWWNENGESIGLTLNFKDKKSDGYKQYKKMAALSERLKKRNEGRSLFDVLFPEYRGFCATGLGNGIDNSCGARVMNSPDTGSGGGVAAGGAISAGDAAERFPRYRPFESVGSSKNSDFIRVPSDEEISSALKENDVQQSKIGASRQITENTPVALRIDIPAWTKSEGKTYVVTVHEGKNPDNKKSFGPVLGYDSVARLSGPVRFSANDEDRAQQVAEGKSKTPLATVNGSFSQSREIPSDIDSWTPVGYDPQKAVYFYDKTTGQEVKGGTDALSVGNTVFTRQPQYGSRNAKTHYRSASEMFSTDSWGLESRAWCATGPGGGTDNSCGSSGTAAGSPLLPIEKIIEKIASNPDGFTLDPLSAESPSDGIMVSEFQNDTVRSVTIKASEIETPQGVKRLSEWVSNNADLLVGQADRFIGGWRAGEDFYIDVSTRFPPEKAAQALESGRKAGQLAVFNLGTVKETWVHYDRDDDRKPANYDKKFAKARKESQEKQVYDPDAPAIQDEDWAKDLVTHGKTTVRAYNHQSEEDTSNDQTNSAIRREGQADDHRDVPSNADVLRAGGGVEGQEARSSVVRRRPGDAASPVEGSAGGAGEHRESSVDCGRAPGGIFGPGNNCQLEGDSTSGGAGAGTGWKKSDETSVYNAERLKSEPPSASLAEVNNVTIFNGKTLSASLKEVGVTLDQAAKVCGNLSPDANVVVAHGTLKDVVNWIDNPSRASDPESSVTVVSQQPFGGVEDAVGTAATLSRTEDDELLLSYVMFSVAPEAQRDNPVAVARALYSGVVKSINEAERAGVEEVGMLAAGSESNDEFKGYRIWPRLGFDGVIPRSKITPTYSLRLGFFEKYGSNLPDEILSDRAKQEKSEGALTIQSLYDTKEGQRWWEENGGAMPMFLRVGDNEDAGWQRFTRISSKVSSRDIIDVIDIEWRDIRGDVEERGFCPTGLGNGVDNSCGGGVNMAPDKDGGGGSAAGSSLGAGKPASVTVESQESLDKAVSVLGLGGVDDVVKISGGNVRGAKVDVYADSSGFTKVSALWPIDKSDPDGGGKVFTEVSMASTPEGKVLGFESFGPSGGSISSGADQQKVISIISEKVAESIEAAEENGFIAVTTFAVGDANNPYKGYRLWPQFGFDADLPRDLAKRVPPEIVLKSKGVAIPPPGSTSIPHDLVVKSLASQNRDLTIQELISTREGKRWWDQNGDDISLKLDLTDKSSLGYKKWSEMKDRLPTLRERNQTRSFFDSLVESRDADCGRTPDGKFGSSNKCQEEGDGATTATQSGGALTKARNVDVMIDGGKTTAVIDEEARTRAIQDTASHPRPEGLSAGSTADLWSRTFVERNGSTKTKITATDPVFPQDRLAMNGTYVAHESVGQYLSMRHEEDRAAAGGVGPGAIIDTTQVLTQSQFTYVSDAMSDDVMHAYESGRFDPGFYSKDLEDAMTKMASRHPELATDDNSRFVFTMLTAILSNGQDPTANIADSDGVYEMYKEHGTCLPAGKIAGTRSAAAKTSLALFQSMLDSFGVERTKNLLSGYTTAENVNRTFAAMSAKSSNAEWRERTDSKPWMTDHYKAKDKKTGEALATTNLVKTDSSGEFKDEVVPMASIFGPKIGSFFANLNGRHDFLTMDRWLMRSIGRTTGELITRSTPQGAKSRADDALKALDVDSWKPSVYMFGIDKEYGITKQDLIRSLKIQQRTGVIEENGAAYLWAIAAERSHKNTPKPDGGGYGKDPNADKHACHVAGNGLFKSLIHEQQDPRGAQARRSIREVFRSVVQDIEAKYPDRKGKVDVDEVQAILWQYEKNLWKHLGAKVQIDENSLYSKAADDLLTGKTKERKFKPESRAALLEALRDIGDSNDDWQFQAEQESWDSDIGESGIDFNELFLELERIVSEEKAPSPLESAKNTVADLRAVGLSTVEMPKAGLDGLHVMGFDAEIPPDLVEKLPESLSHAKTLLDLHVSDEGQEWWKENGRDIDVSIDLDGVQGQIFDSFTAGKRWEDIIEEGILDDYGIS